MELDALAIRGNADRELIGAATGGLSDEWAQAQLGDQHKAFLAGLPEQLEVDVEGVGRVLFCHGSPRSDEEMILRTTPDEWLREMLEGVDADVVVCGHTHMQFDRTVDGIRVVNAGSVGLSYGPADACWAVVEDGGVELRRTAYDREAVRASAYAKVDDFLEEHSEEEVVAFFEAQAAAAG
jgi:predicted phosphodiesterase